jgi:UDP-N-acetylglucosamine 1-carboxyvinyltransferase
MEYFLVTGGRPISGRTCLSGAKNVALKVIAASLLTSDRVTISNIPDIADVRVMLALMSSLGVRCEFKDHVVTLENSGSKAVTVPLEYGARLRTSILVLGPLLSTRKFAHVPNPGGCRIGARPVDRQIIALTAMGAAINYDHRDGYFHARSDKLHGAKVSFPKNSHTGTEAVILSAVLAEGKTVIENAAEEVEIDDLIRFLCLMGAKIDRTRPREITVTGVSRLHGVSYEIMSDRNEEVTLAVLAGVTGGEIEVDGSVADRLTAFLGPFQAAGGKVDRTGSVTKYSGKKPFRAVDIVTAPHPGFMTDWQAPFAVMMTQAVGKSSIHETIFESRFAYVSELQKMGAEISFYSPPVADLHNYYNFNVGQTGLVKPQAIRITGPVQLHNAVLEMQDLRAGATLLLAALAAGGQSVIYGIEQIDRGYEQIDLKLRNMGADIVRTTKEGL